MFFSDDTLSKLDPKTEKLLRKLNRTDAFVDNYVDYLVNLHDRLMELINDDFFFSFNEEWRRLRKEFRVTNRLLRNHLRKYTKNFVSTRACRGFQPRTWSLFK